MHKIAVIVAGSAVYIPFLYVSARQKLLSLYFLTIEMEQKRVYSLCENVCKMQKETWQTA